MRSSITGTLLASTLAGVQAASPLYKSPVDIPGYGKVQGKAALNSTVSPYVHNWEDISFFGGIPFGADTAGSNRWRDPQPASAWNGTLNATSFGPICPQSISQLDTYTMSEDCLTVNIWTSATSSDEKLPVAIWSYGAGTAPPQTTYNGAGVASKGIVFVSYNYRAGALGFLASPELTEETGRNASGNWGMLDQFAAVKWVHENIAAFGGDPEHISTIGQSFGAAGVYHIVNSPLTKDLGIVNAISESGVRSPNDPNVDHYECAYINQTYADTLGTSVLDSLNVSSLAAARALSYETILDSVGSAAEELEPVLDYYAVPSKYVTSLSHPAHKIPYITGNNADEDGASLDLSTTVAAYLEDLETNYSNYSSDFLALYPAANASQAGASEDALVRDQFRVSSWQYMLGYSAYTGVDSYTYYWTYAPPNDDGASHASEIPYVLGNLWAQTDVAYTSEDYYISNVMSSYWANFMKTGNPNTGGSYKNGTLPAVWEANSGKKETFLVGEEYEMIPIAKEKNVELLLEFFAAQTPY